MTRCATCCGLRTSSRARRLLRVKSLRAKASATPAPIATLALLLRRLATAPDGVTVGKAELAEWPPADVRLLEQAGLLVPASAADRMECPGCEQACGMPVEVVQRPGRPPAVFIVCDKPEAMGLVKLTLDDLAQWRITRSAVALALARLLGGPGAVPADETPAGQRVGVVTGASSTQPVMLKWQGDARLLVAGHELELALVLGCGVDGPALDLRQLAQCVNAPAVAEAAVREAPEHRRQRFIKLRDQEKAKAPAGCLERGAKRAGVNVDAFKQVIYRKVKPTSAMQQTAAMLISGPISKGRKAR